MSRKISENSTSSNFNYAIIIAAFILLVINTGTYWKARNHDFVWDDQRTHIHNNQNLMQDHIAEFWKAPYVGLYIPVSYTTWNWIKNISLKEVRGNKIPDPKTFHTINIFLHAINSLLVLFLIYLLTANPWISFAGTLLFSIHPMQVETVVWISEYRGLLATFFSLALLIAYFIYRKNENKDIRIIILSTVLFIAAVLSKPSAIVLPFITAGFEFFIFKGNIKKYLIPLAWFVLTVPVMTITKLSQPGSETEFVAAVWSRIFIAGDAVGFYLYKFFLPVNLSASYGRTPEAVMESTLFYFLWIIPVTLLYLVWRFRKTEPLMSLGIFIFLFAILPVSGLLSFDFQKFSTVADRYLYFSMIGAAIVLSRILIKFKNNNWIFYTGSFVAVLFLFINWSTKEKWRDDLTLWKTTTQQNPAQPHVHNNYGISLHDAGRYDEAIQQYNLALQARPEFASAYNNRGNSHAFKRDFQNALTDQSRAIELDPDYGRAWFNRAVTHFQLENLEQALNDLNEAVKRGYKPHPQFRKDLEREFQKRK